MADIILALTTWPDETGARSFAQRLLEQRLAACINVLPTMRSFYTWQGKMESGTEHQLLIKTTRDCVPAIERVLREQHPYDLAEFLTLPVESGGQAFINWIHESTHAE